MSQAAIVINEPLSPSRIGGIAAAMVVHVAAFMLLMAPMTYVPPAVDTEETFIIPDYEKPEPIKIPPPPEQVVKKETKPVIVPVVQQQTITPPDVPQVTYNDSTANDVPYVPPSTETIGEVIPPPSGPISLSTEYAPAPRYPPISLRNGEEGSVLLLVQVGADGRPIGATIKKSSGYKELDRNALKHVLATWRFHPAMHQGIPIPALALVPVDYKIDQ